MFPSGSCLRLSSIMRNKSVCAIGSNSRQSRFPKSGHLIKSTELWIFLQNVKAALST